MQVQLHPLLRRGILPALMLDAHDAHRLELYVLAVEAQRQLALHPQPHAVADSAAQYLASFSSIYFRTETEPCSSVMSKFMHH